jgi:molecular chaperone GrpE (heat shock protein)
MIMEEFKRGYTLGDRVLRLAQVKVAVASSFA